MTLLFQSGFLACVSISWDFPKLVGGIVIVKRICNYASIEQIEMLLEILTALKRKKNSWFNI